VLLCCVHISPGAGTRQAASSIQRCLANMVLFNAAMNGLASYKKSSGDDIANVAVLTSTSYM